jgi:hypothetical protein
MLPIEKVSQIQTEPELQDQMLFRELSAHINTLIRDDFEQLVRLLYRMDVSEEKLRRLLKDNPDTDAGELIAALMIERQRQKIKVKQAFKQEDVIDADEAW